MTFDTPHGRPIDIHAVITRSTAPAAIMSSPSVHMRLRTSVRPRRRALKISRTRASGVREKRSEEHTSELQSRLHLVCRLLLEKKNETEWPGVPPLPPRSTYTTRCLIV